METLFIARVRKIAKDAKGANINIVVIDLTNGKPSIVRNFTQFLQDLKNSFLIDESVNSINHPQVTRVLRGLKRGMVSGEITFTKKGDEYVVTENSRVITDITHPEFGKFAIGDKRIAEEDRTIVEGFLDVETNEDHQTIQATAEATAQAKMAMQGAFEDFNNIANSPVDDVVEDIPKAIIDEVVKTKDDKSKDKK